MGETRPLSIVETVGRTAKDKMEKVVGVRRMEMHYAPWRLAPSGVTPLIV